MIKAKLFLDEYGSVDLTLPIYPAIGDKIDLIEYTQMPEWVDCTPEVWDRIKEDGLLITSRIFEGDAVYYHARRWD